MLATSATRDRSLVALSVTLLMFGVLSGGCPPTNNDGSLDVVLPAVDASEFEITPTGVFSNTLRVKARYAHVEEFSFEWSVTGNPSNYTIEDPNAPETTVTVVDLYDPCVFDNICQIQLRVTAMPSEQYPDGWSSTSSRILPRAYWGELSSVNRFEVDEGELLDVGVVDKLGFVGQVAWRTELRIIEDFGRIDHEVTLAPSVTYATDCPAAGNEHELSVLIRPDGFSVCGYAPRLRPGGSSVRLEIRFSEVVPENTQLAFSFDVQIDVRSNSQ